MVVKTVRVSRVYPKIIRHKSRPGSPLRISFPAASPFDPRTISASSVCGRSPGRLSLLPGRSGCATSRGFAALIASYVERRTVSTCVCEIIGEDGSAKDRETRCARARPSSGRYRLKELVWSAILSLQYELSARRTKSECDRFPAVELSVTGRDSLRPGLARTEQMAWMTAKAPSRPRSSCWKPS